MSQFKCEPRLGGAIGRKNLITIFIGLTFYLSGQSFANEFNCYSTLNGRASIHSSCSKAEGGFVIIGYDKTQYDPQKMLIMSFYENGKLFWARTYEPAEGLSIEQIQDGRFVAITTSGLMMIDRSGNVVWEKKYKVGYSGTIVSIAATGDGGFMIAANDVLGVGQGINGQAALIKFGLYGNVQWAKCYGGGLVQFKSVKRLGTDDYIVLGKMGESAWISRTDSLGNIEWHKAISGYFEINSISGTTDQAIILYGSDSSGRLILMKISALGEIVWQNLFGWHSYRGEDQIVALEGGRFIVAGEDKSPRLPTY